MKYLYIVLIIALTGCNKTITVFDSKEFYVKVIADSAYTEKFILPPSQSEEPNFLIYRDATAFTYKGISLPHMEGTTYATDTIFIYSPLTGKIYNLTEDGLSKVYNEQPNKDRIDIMKLSVWSMGTKYLIMKKAGT